jgi:hypothetical protein
MLAALALVAGCQSSQVGAGQKAILVDDYAMIPTDPAIFDCQDSETTEQFWNVRSFKYPSRQISWDATGADGSERGPYKVVSSAEAPAELWVPVTITFDLTTDCEKLKQFHRDFGTKYLPSDQDDVVVEQNDGWKQLLNYVIGQPTEVTLIGISQKYNWRQIWNDEKIRAEYQQALQTQLPEASKRRTNNEEYFTNFQVTVIKPDPVDAGLKQAIINEQNAIANARAAEAQGVADANARKAKADADVKAALAETEVARQEALRQAAEIAGFPSVEDWLRAKAVEKGITVWPSPIITGAR